MSLLRCSIPGLELLWPPDVGFPFLHSMTEWNDIASVSENDILVVFAQGSHRVRFSVVIENRSSLGRV